MMEYEEPYTGWHALGILALSCVIAYYGMYTFVWVIKYFWGIV